MTTVMLSGALAEEEKAEAAQTPAPTAEGVESAQATPTAPEEKTFTPEQTKARELYAQAAGLYSQRRFWEAGTLLEEIEKLVPDDPQVAMMRGGVYAETRQFDKAREVFQELLKKAPDDFSANFNLAEIIMMEKRYGDAREEFAKLLEKYPKNDFLAFKILLTYLAESNREDAIEWLKKLERPEPTPVMSYGAAAVAISSGNLELGQQLMLEVEQRFGAGRHRMLFESLAGINLVLVTDYPPGQPATPLPTEVSVGDHKEEAAITVPEVEKE